MVISFFNDSTQELSLILSVVISLMLGYSSDSQPLGQILTCNKSIVFRFNSKGFKILKDGFIVSASLFVVAT
jgi:hypothetical protein